MLIFYANIIVSFFSGTSFPGPLKLSECGTMSGMVTMGTLKLSTSLPGTRLRNAELPVKYFDTRT